MLGSIRALRAGDRTALGPHRKDTEPSRIRPDKRLEGLCIRYASMVSRSRRGHAPGW